MSKKKKVYQNIAEFSTDDILCLVPDTDYGKVKRAFGKYNVKLSSQRLITFKRNRSCVCCGITGTKMLLQLGYGQQTPHFNMYANTPYGLVLMTKDHIIPKSKGGKDCLSNYQTMCYKCNEFKCSMAISLEQLKIIVNVWNASYPKLEKVSYIKNFLKVNDIESKHFINKYIEKNIEHECKQA